MRSACKTLNWVFTIIFITIGLNKAFGQTTTVSGIVTDADSREALIGATISTTDGRFATITNTYGYYSLQINDVKSDSVTLVYSFVGGQPYKATYKTGSYSRGDVGIQTLIELNAVEVVADRERQYLSESVEMSKIDVPIAQVKYIPALLGEKDVLKVMQLLPGVQTGGEGQSGLYVRGGGPDQNLIILDDAPVYNASHLFGFFSVFNGDALKSAELYKGGFPARFGGRLSSVVNLTMKEGNMTKYSAEGSIGLIASRLVLEGPIKKDKASFIFAARRTYLDLLLLPLQPSDTKFGYYFYDLNAKTNYIIGKNDRLYIGGYFGRDRFYFRDFSAGANYPKQGIDWGNATLTARWNHIFGPNLFANTLAIFTQYRFRIESEERDNAFNYYIKYYSGIRDFSAKTDFDWLPRSNHSIKFGGILTWHTFTPAALITRSSGFDGFNLINNIHNQEIGLYIEDEYRLNPKTKMLLGLRFSGFFTEGKSYFMPEPRLSVAHTVLPRTSVKASFASMNQYLHLLSNTGIGLPTDLWVPSTNIVEPQRSNQVALGVVHDLKNVPIALSVEGYYKTMEQLLGYREGASFLLLDEPELGEKFQWEKNVTSGEGYSTGIEFLIQKKTGKLNGWVGYTLSRTEQRFGEVNLGRWFPARHDRRHDISVVLNYAPTEKIEFSTVWVYGTGQAITVPTANYKSFYNDVLGFNYTDATQNTSRNGFRMQPYHRLDVALRFIKNRGRYIRTWELSGYNVYARKNPFFYYINTDINGDSKLMKMPLFMFIPSVAYIFKF